MTTTNATEATICVELEARPKLGRRVAAVVAVVDVAALVLVIVVLGSGVGGSVGGTVVVGTSVVGAAVAGAVGSLVA